MTTLQLSDIQNKFQIVKAKEIGIDLQSRPVKFYRQYYPDEAGKNVYVTPK